MIVHAMPALCAVIFQPFLDGVFFQLLLDWLVTHSGCCLHVSMRNLTVDRCRTRCTLTLRLMMGQVTRTTDKPISLDVLHLRYTPRCRKAVVAEAYHDRECCRSLEASRNSTRPAKPSLAAASCWWGRFAEREFLQALQAKRVSVHS